MTMDRPLLALTRPSLAPAGPSAETTAGENMRQLIQLRWIAVAGQLITILAVHFGLGVQLPLAPMLILVGVLALANLDGAYWLVRRVSVDQQILLALLLDTSALTAQLYLSGGASNPFISLYLLQVVLGAILLGRRGVWILVVVTSLCYAGLSKFSLPLAYPSRLSNDAIDLYRIGAWISYALICVLLTLFISRISRNLRARDAHVAELQRHAVEEDSIVRMGLFASGAAHELGTPLASLSVIINDWRRMPQLARNSALAEDLAVMEAEVQRCKSIVSDILDSAGAPREEALHSTGARQLVEEITSAWRERHPKVALSIACDAPADTVTVSSPALRQAIWNLLDNAAEVSPDSVTLRASASHDELAICILDAGPGFQPGQLAAVGKPQPSSKGPGHGVGLFLAANAARKVGGRLQASNRPSGGAEVCLVVPLAANPQDESHG
jgi:two-component system sensor histidine kinase RegB